VKMYKLMGAGEGYCVIIHGDGRWESRSKPTLEDAITEASEKYAKWLNETDDDDPGQGCDCPECGGSGRESDEMGGGACNHCGGDGHA
jgi:hypothetical protein